MYHRYLFAIIARNSIEFITMSPPLPLPRSLHLRPSPISSVLRQRTCRASGLIGGLCSCAHLIVSTRAISHSRSYTSSASFQSYIAPSISSKRQSSQNIHPNPNQPLFTHPTSLSLIQFRTFPPLLRHSHQIHARAFSINANMAQEYKLKGLSSFGDLANTDKIEAEVEGVSDGKVLLVNLDGKVHAMSPHCTHYGAPLKNGVVSPDGRLTCPWHGGMSSYQYFFFRLHVHCEQYIRINFNEKQPATTSELEMSRMHPL